MVGALNVTRLALGDCAFAETPDLLGDKQGSYIYALITYWSSAFIDACIFRFRQFHGKDADT